MKRGSTPTFTFEIPFDVSAIQSCFVTMKQTVGNKVVQIDKSKDQCVLQDKTISCDLTQEDTLKFDAHRNASVQLRVLTSGGKALVSNVFTVMVGKVLKEGVIE